MTITELQNIILRIQEGDEEAFLQLCEKRGQKIFYVCVKIMGNVPDGEDATQEVFLKMQENILQLKEPAAFSVWLNRIIINTCLNLKRKDEKEKGNFSLDGYQELLGDRDAEFLPSTYLEEKEKREELLSVIEKLSPKYKSIILMYYYEGLSQNEVADVMGLTQNAVEHTLRRARKKIKEELEKSPKITIVVNKDEILQKSALPIITQALNYEAEKIVTQSMVEEAIISSQSLVAGVSSGVIAGGLGASLVMKITGAIATIVVVVATGVYFATHASSAPSASAVGGDAANSLVTKSSSDTTQDVYAPQQVPSTVVSEEGLDINVPEQIKTGPVDKGTENKQSVLVELAGRVVIEENNSTSSANAIANKYLDGLVVQIKDAQQNILGKTKLDVNGKYKFQEITAVLGESYTVELENSHLAEYSDSSKNPNGTTSVVFKEKEEVAPDIYIKSVASPSIGFLFYNKQTERSSVNPTKCEILISDMVNVSVQWEIMDIKTGEVLKNGEGNVLQEKDFSLSMQGQIKKYLLRVTATNAAGYVSTAEETFTITK